MSKETLAEASVLHRQLLSLLSRYGELKSQPRLRSLDEDKPKSRRRPQQSADDWDVEEPGTLEVFNTENLTPEDKGLGRKHVGTFRVVGGVKDEVFQVYERVA